LWRETISGADLHVKARPEQSTALLYLNLRRGLGDQAEADQYRE
jgi:hypothetical protein